MGAVVVVVLAAAVTWAVVRVQSDSGTAAPRASATASLTPETAATNSGSASAASSSPTTGDAALATARRTLAACAATIAAREQLARAAAASARDWSTHTGAQRRLDSGQWTEAQAKAAWASSKAHGSADVKQFAAAEAAVEAADSSACRAVVTRTASTSLAGKGTACAAREKALLSVASTGSVVNTQWAAHIKMMADRAHTSQGDYHDRWVTMVAEAEAPLKRYAAAAAALDRAPVCSP
ncbi:hypothetical protein [Phycicoccus sp. SLBN-51]|uniref:hypothetical protein n=1 Tax=Phycicoccus sp. SLBN-51 TaxID=2768447 RepID=UPI00116652C1|nr:hypothetical protein [Phycicoccus sp. SLBN-51]TQJ52256.1 hypothetical protein FBY26_4008 [Phycicoccus sp. SLBN-51]